MVIIIWRRRSASAHPLLVSSFPPWSKSWLTFAPLWTFILFYLAHPELIPPAYKSTYLISRSFVYPSGAFGGRCTHHGRTIPVTPTYTSLVSNRTLTFFFVDFSLYHIWLALGVNSFTAGFVCTSFHRTHASPPYPSYLTFPSPVCILIQLAGNGSRMWLVPPLGRSACGSFLSYGRALCPLSVSPFVPPVLQMGDHRLDSSLCSNR
jgi:hypothetical protein